MKKKPTPQKKEASVNEDKTLALYSSSIAELLHRVTPKEFIDKHPFSGLDYVQVGYVRRCLEDLCAKLNAYWLYEVSEVGAIELLLKIKHIVVRGKLTLVFRKTGEVLVREQFGGSDVKCYKHNHATKPDQPMDLGNDYKSAASDALKKCASSFGVAQDIFEPKVEKKVNALKEKEAAGQGASDPGIPNKKKPIEGEVVDPPKKDTMSAAQGDKPDNEKITMKEVALLARMLQANEKHRGKVRTFMKKEFGHELTTRLMWGQYRKLYEYFMGLNPEEAPF